MKNKFFLGLIHLPVLLVTTIVAIIVYSRGKEGYGQSFAIGYSITLVLWFLTGFYTFFSYLIPKYLEKSKYKRFAIYSVIFLFLLMPFLNFVLTTINHQIFNLYDDAPLIIQPLFFFYWMSDALIIAVCGLLGVFYRFGYDWFYNIQLKKDLENKNLRSELEVLKSRLNPHFLFNTINNIDNLIETNTEQASSNLTKLAELFRYVIYDTNAEEITIQKEIESLNKYIDLEKIRLHNPSSISFTTKVLNDVMIAPMIFMPFVENAFKHCNLNELKQKLEISIEINKDELYFKCTNSIYNSTINKSDSGIGLELAKKRLSLLYPEKHTLTINQRMKEFEVNLKINLC